MERRAVRLSRPLCRCLSPVLAVLALAGCAASAPGPDSNTFVHQVRQALGEATEADVPVSRLVGQRWQQLCMHREGSLAVRLIEVDNRHVLRVPFRQLSVHDAASPDSLDGKCLRRDELVHLRRQGSGADAAIVLERSRADSPADAALASN